MPTVYKIEILNHLVDAYEQAQIKLHSADKWLASCKMVECDAWREKDTRDDPQNAGAITNADRVAADRRVREKMERRHDAESERNVAHEREQQAMRMLCDAVLLAAVGVK